MGVGGGFNLYTQGASIALGYTSDALFAYMADKGLRIDPVTKVLQSGVYTPGSYTFAPSYAQTQSDITAAAANAGITIVAMYVYGSGTACDDGWNTV
jgi:hypothetical protein